MFLNLTNELSSLQKRKFLILLIHSQTFRKIRSHSISKLRIIHLIEIVVALLIWKFWIRKVLFWLSCMTHFRKIRSHYFSRIWKFRSQWICRLSNISWTWMILLLKLLILILQWIHFWKTRRYSKSKIQKHWKKIRSIFFTNCLHFLFSISALISTSNFIQSIQKSHARIFKLRLHFLDEKCNYHRFVILHCVTFHLIEIVAILILLIRIYFRFLFVFLFSLSMSSFRMSFLKSWIFIFMRKSNCFVRRYIFLFRLLSNVLLLWIRTSMKRNNFVFLLILMLFTLLLLLKISMRSFWSLIWSILRKILFEYHFWILLNTWFRNRNIKNCRK